MLFLLSDMKNDCRMISQFLAGFSGLAAATSADCRKIARPGRRRNGGWNRTEGGSQQISAEVLDDVLLAAADWQFLVQAIQQY
jgi:hypothetical protein